MPTLVQIQETKARITIPIDDRILLGEGLFETLRVVNSKPQYPKYHWQRLQKAAFFLGISFELSFEVWLSKLNQCITLTELKEGGIKVILTGGSASRGLLERGQDSLLVLDAFEYLLNKTPLNLISAPWQRDAKNPLYQLKSVNYLEAILARRHAQAMGVDDVLFFNFQNQVTDTTIANLFLIKEGEILTPSLHCGVLAGTIRQRLLALCKEKSIACFEAELTKTTLQEAEAMFVCNALQGIQPIGSFEGKTYAPEHPLIRLLNELLTKDNSDN